MTTRLTTATLSGGRWDGSRSASRSRMRARQPATTEDETSRISNIRHLNRGDDDDNKEADNDDSAQLDNNSPATATTLSSAILRSLFSWLHSTANKDNEDGYGEKGQHQSSACCKSSKFGYNDVDNGPDEDIEEVDGGWGVPRW